MKADRPIGTCPICDLEYAIRLDGKLWPHGAHRHRCSGSWEKPKSVEYPTSKNNAVS